MLQLPFRVRKVIPGTQKPPNRTATKPTALLVNAGTLDKREGRALEEQAVYRVLSQMLHPSHHLKSFSKWGKADFMR